MDGKRSKSEDSRAKMVASAGESFRRSGFGGIGVDGLAKTAGLTSGAFYFHFRSKIGAFVEAVEEGMEALRRGIEQMQEQHGKHWLEEFVSFYLGYKRTCDMGQGCTLPTLTSEVERAGPEARLAYQTKLVQTSRAIQQGLASPKKLTKRDLATQEQSWALLALLSGGVAMARAVQDPVLSEEIAAAVAKAAAVLGTPSRPNAGQ